MLPLCKSQLIGQRCRVFILLEGARERGQQSFDNRVFFRKYLITRKFWKFDGSSTKEGGKQEGGELLNESYGRASFYSRRKSYLKDYVGWVLIISDSPSRDVLHLAQTFSPLFYKNNHIIFHFK